MKGGQFMSNTAQATQEIVFPDLVPFLYRGVGSLVNLQKLYNEEVKKAADKLRGDVFEANFLDLYYTKLQNYLNNYYNYQSVSGLEQEMMELKQFLFNQKIPCNISGRLKNYIALVEKVRTFIYDGLDPFSINDELGFRIIVGKSRYDDDKSIQQLYSIANAVISFFVVAKGYKLLLPSPAIGCGFDPKLYPDVFVPKNSLILPEYSIYVKDYFVRPKKKGYQALHMVFLTKSGLIMEVQIRTFASHYHAEYISTHEMHKESRYGKSVEDSPQLTEAQLKRQQAIKISFDPEKVNLDSYFSKDGKTLDLIGLAETIRDPFNNFFVA